MMIRAQYRIQSAIGLIKNALEPKVVRRCLDIENKRLWMQLIYGRRVSYAEAMLEM